MRILVSAIGVITMALSSTTTAGNLRSTEQIRREGNQLTTEQSVYLRQHAHNPVDWYPWGERALQRARAEDKPIFLSIGYASCHWCHVMEHEVFDHDDVAAFLNEHFVSIKVDREERPDLDAVYMEAVMALNSSGGWPMSVFLTPELKPFFGGTYFPRATFLSLIRRIRQLYSGQRGRIDAQAEALADAVSADPRLTPGAVFDAALLDEVASRARARYDERWGGFQGRQKFPTPVRWQFLLQRYRRTGDESLARMLRITLDAMASGGIQDHVGGGFHRYTVEPTWLVPHFEKMLYDNAQLAGLYLEASVVLDEPRYAVVARDTLDFLIREMSDGQGFFASFDADSGGEEGSYYVWTPTEIAAAVGERDAEALSALLGVTAAGNFEGQTVLTRRAAAAEVAQRTGRPEAEVATLLDRHREALRAHRSRRTPPGLDRKVVGSWNGMAVAAMARGYAVLGDARYLGAAEAAADFLWRVHRHSDGTLARASTEGRTAGEGVVDDYAFLACGLLELHQATGDEQHLRRALALIDHAREYFRHPTAGFYHAAEDVTAPLGRQVQFFDSVRPSGNAMMLQALLRAAALTGNAEYRQDVEIALKAYSDLMGRAGLEMAGWLLAAEQFLGPFYEVAVAGQGNAAGTRALLEAYRELHPTHAVLVRVPASGPSNKTAALLPPTRGKTALQGQPTAYVCEHGACKQPTSDPDTLRSQLMEGWKR